MKKLFPLLFLVAGFAGCKKAETPAPASEAPAAAAAPAQPQDPNAVNPAELEGSTAPAAAVPQSK